MATSDSKYIVSSGRDSTIRIWNRQETTQEAVLKDYIENEVIITITNNNKYIVSSGSNKTVIVWKLQIRK